MVPPLNSAVFPYYIDFPLLSHNTCKKGAKSLVLDETMDEVMDWAECD